MSIYGSIIFSAEGFYEVLLKTKSEKEAINAVLNQFDTDVQSAEATLRDAALFDFEEV